MTFVPLVVLPRKCSKWYLCPQAKAFPKAAWCSLETSAISRAFNSERCCLFIDILRTMRLRGTSRHFVDRGKNDSKVRTSL